MENTVCPSCGALQSGNISCDVCGYNFTAADVPAVTPTASVTSAEPAARGGFCHSCGAPVTTSHRFCASCGTPLQEGAAQVTARLSSPMPMKTILVAGGVIVLLVVGIVLLTNALRDKPPATTAVAPGQGEQAAPAAPEKVATQEQLHAVAEFKKQVAENPKDTLALLHLANSLYDIMNFSEAVPYYREYLEINPKNSDVRVDYAFALFRAGDVDQAIVENKNAIKMRPDHQIAYYNLGIMYLTGGKMEDGVVWLQKCIAIDSTSAVGKQASSLLTNHSSMLHKP